MLLFSRKKTVGVQSFLVKLINNHCPQLREWMDNRRDGTRIPLTIVIQVVPVEGGKLQLADHFATVTKEFSSTGVSIVLDQPRGLDEVILAFRHECEMTFLRGTARHLSPIGAGFYQLGIDLSSTVAAGDYPELQRLVI